MRRAAAFLALCLAPSLAGARVVLPAVRATFTVTLKAGAQERLDTPVSVPILVPTDLADAREVAVDAGFEPPLTGQLTPLGLGTAGRALAISGTAARELHFVVPRLAAGQSLKVTVHLDQRPPVELPAMRWEDTPDKKVALTRDGKPVLAYEYAPLDESTRQARELTYKVYHQIYSPDGARLVTKGPGGLYTHHRGIFYGFNQVTYGDGKMVDIWHCPVGWQAHAAFEEQLAGPLLARQRVRIEWHGVNREVFAAERREVTVYPLPGGTLVEWRSALRTAGEVVKLDGDPQHAGFHFRAAQEVADQTKGQTYFLRPDGQGKPGETRNWPAQKDHVNLPWDAMSFILGGQRYTVAYLDRPDNPKEARFSERDYGRFGSYFVHTLDADHPELRVAYRLWLQAGEMTGADVARLSGDWVTPPGAEVTAPGG